MFRRAFGCLFNLVGTVLLLAALAWMVMFWLPVRLVIGVVEQELPQVAQLFSKGVGEITPPAPDTPKSGARCPTVSGQFTSAATGRRILLNVAVQGPAETLQTKAILDSGAAQTAFPDSFLRSLGFRPIGRPHTVEGVGTGEAVAYTYRIPYPLVAAQGRWVPMGSGTLEVEGIKGFDLVLIGPDVLERGVSLTTSGSDWTLTLPCGTRP